MFSENVKLEDGTTKRVTAGSEEDLKAAVKVAKEQKAPVYPNINHPVQKGHDLVAVDEDVNHVLVDGTGAHNSPNDAVKPFSKETDKGVKAPGEDEPAYKTVPTPANNDVPQAPEVTDAQVAAARKDSEPAEEVR